MFLPCLFDRASDTSASWRRGLLCSAVASILLCSAAASFAQQLGSFEEEFDDEEKPWQEIAVQLPAAPQAADLAEFYVGPTATSTSAVDLRSLTVGSDGIIRYTIVTRMSGGAVNTTYEGIRCQTGEKKLYAFGQADGTWSRSRQNSWKRIADVGANRQDAALYKDYFCQGSMISGTEKSIIARLRNKRPVDYTRNYD